MGTKQEQDQRIEEAKRSAALHKRNMLLKRIGLWGGVFILLGGMVWAMANFASAPATDPSSNLTVSPTSTDHSFGKTGSKVTLVEYSDFQCPACAQFYPVIKSIEQKYGNDILFVYRYFPLPTHDKSEIAARAAEAAAQQGKFFEMHDKLFETQNDWTGASDPVRIFTDYAVQLGLNKDRFTRDMNSTTTASRIERDIESGTASKVDATPTFFLNGKKITNLQTYGDLESDVADAVAQSR
jgi:protein-disulfide isomerase